MRGVLRPCRSHLGPELGERWQAHLCGLCLTLREVAGQPERALTGYDVLLLSVLVEAQAGRLDTAQAGACPLRAMRAATVVASSTPAAQLAAAGALLSGGAGLADKLADGDLPRGSRGAARRVSARLSARGRAVAAGVGLDPAAVLGAPAAAADAEAHPEDGLPALLAPAAEAVAALFAQTAVVAGRPDNHDALADCGRAFGALVHLLDAVDDHAADGSAGRFNPLAATGTRPDQAWRLAEDLRGRVGAALDRADLVDRSLVDALLGRELRTAVARRFPDLAAAHTCTAAVPAQRTASPTGVLAALSLLMPAVFVGGWSSSGGSGCGPRRRRVPRGYGGYGGYGPRYGRVRRVGPSCSEQLACNCCANLACNACCCHACNEA